MTKLSILMTVLGMFAFTACTETTTLTTTRSGHIQELDEDSFVFVNEGGSDGITYSVNEETEVQIYQADEEENISWATFYNLWTETDAYSSSSNFEVTIKEESVKEGDVVTTGIQVLSVEEQP